MPRVAKPLLGKVKIEGVLRAVTGLHIGASKEVLEIGAVDLPVVRNPVTREPYIPGSSLKGKLRSLLERGKAREQNPEDPPFFNRDSFKGQIRLHVCPNADEASRCQVCRLFGSSADRSKENVGSNFPARLRVRDAFFTEYTREKLARMETGLLYTELKFENSLDRVTAAANPRQIERVPPGSDFAFELVYDVENPGQLRNDLVNLFRTMMLLQDDALGGHGSRGSGMVRFYVSRFSGKNTQAYWGEEGAKAAAPIDRDITQEGIRDLKSLGEVARGVDDIVSLFR